jgi:cytochrome c556
MKAYWRRFAFIYSALMLGALAAAYATAAEHDPKKLPPGPIRDRHELMEGVGKNAEKIGDSLKAGKPEDAAEPAEAIAAVMDRFVTLFPPGSTDPNSRAKPEIWEQKAKFDDGASELKAKALSFAAAARRSGDTKTTSREMWAACKSCHESFRIPKPGEGK